MNSAAHICLGVIVAAHGVRGQVKIKTFTAQPGAVAAYGPLRDRSGQRTLRLAAVRPVNGGVVAAVEGIKDRDAAEALRGTELFVPRAALPPTDDDEFYQQDLIGMDVVDGAGRAWGAVLAVHNFGAGDVLEIAPPQGATFFLPFTRDAVPTVDMAARRLVATDAGLALAQSLSEVKA
jgi:16S rRNA processing protein RimM